MNNTEEMIQQAELMLEYFKAERDGKPFQVEYMSMDTNMGLWYQINKPNWNFAISRYRKKPEPLQAWFICRDDEIYRTFQSKDKAFRVLEEYDEEFFRVVHMREVK